MEFVGDVLIVASLWFIMFSMGLSLKLEDFERVFSHRRALLVRAGSMLLSLPVLGTVIAVLFAPTPALAVGFILLATCLGGMLSNLMADITKGDLALSLSLSILVSLVYIFVVPFHAYGATSWFLGNDGFIEVPLLNSIARIFSITLLPVSLGVAVRRLWPGLAIVAKPYIKWGATTVLVLLSSQFLQIDTLKATAAFGPLLFMVALMNRLALAMASGFPGRPESVIRSGSPLRRTLHSAGRNSHIH